MPRNPFESPAETRLPIETTSESVTYLGVRLEKAERRDSQFVPKPEQYANFINDPGLALPLQKDIAIAFLSGEPMLIEGGTSLGKTTTVRKMCADLGYEVHYVNLNGATDIEDLMGRYVPNAEKRKSEDPEYRFADGKVTSGLREEEGKIKVIVLDEFNAAAPNILIRLHEVIDALERNGEVVLSEDASEVLATSKQTTKIVALMNPPGKGYFGREPLDPAQLRRWVYKKLPSELPAATFSLATDTLFGVAVSELRMASKEAYASTRKQTLLPEQLQEIPGIVEILEKYKEFHKAAKELVKNRQVAEDQPQQFTYDDRMEPRRVRDFVMQFYQGDIDETFQQALQYFYANKLESAEDKNKLFELIRLVESGAKPAKSKRKGLERVERPATKEAIETGSPLPQEQVARILERNLAWQWEFFGKSFDMPPLPSAVTPERLRHWESLKYELRYLPRLTLKEADTYPGWKKKPGKRHTPDKQYGIEFFDELENIQSLTENASNPNLSELAPNELPGVWTLVDTRAKPNYDNGKQPYEDDKSMQEFLQYVTTVKDASGEPILNEEAKEGLRNNIHPDVFRKPEFWTELKKLLQLDGVDGATVRLPRVIEQNVTGQVPNWHGTNTYEWAEEYYQSGGRLFSCRSDYGGASYVSWGGGPDVSVGFRPLVVFSSDIGTLEPVALELWEKKVEKLRKRESEKLSSFFEKTVDVPPLPAEITPERLENWEKLGMELHYFPAEDMTKDRKLKAWKKRPDGWFYDQIKNGEIPASASQLPEGWFVIDGRQKPAYTDGTQMYDKDVLAPVLTDLKRKGIIKRETRFSLHPEDFEKPGVVAALAKALDIAQAEFSLPETIVWNIIANIHHPEWGTTNTYEWLREKAGSGRRLISGSSSYGGASSVGWGGEPRAGVGFRPLGRFSP